MWIFSVCNDDGSLKVFLKPNPLSLSIYNTWLPWTVDDRGQSFLCYSVKMQQIKTNKRLWCDGVSTKTTLNAKHEFINKLTWMTHNWWQTSVTRIWQRLSDGHKTTQRSCGRYKPKPGVNRWLEINVKQNTRGTAQQTGQRSKVVLTLATIYRSLLDHECPSPPSSPLFLLCLCTHSSGLSMDGKIVCIPSQYLVICTFLGLL